MRKLIKYLMMISAVMFFLAPLSVLMAATCQEVGGACKGECATTENHIDEYFSDCGTQFYCCRPITETENTCESIQGVCKSQCSAMEEVRGGECFNAMTPFCCVPIEAKSTPTGGSSKVVKTVSLENPLTVDANPSQIIGLIIKSALGVIGGLALVMMVWGAFQWLTSAGNPERVKKGTSTMIWAIVGLILTLGSYVLVNAIFKFLSGSQTGS
jgi:hypothetical protein